MIKVASGELTNPGLLTEIAAAGLPVLVSTGMSTFVEIDVAVDLLRTAPEIAVMQCTSAYPSPPEDIGLNVLGEIAQRYEVPVGLSDHSGTIWPSLAAIALGAQVVEVHLTLSRDAQGPDVVASVTPDELTQLVQGTEMIAAARRSPVDKDGQAASLSEMRSMFMKGLVASGPLARGTRLERSHIKAKKPLRGVPAAELDNVVGKILKRDLEPDQPIEMTDLEEAVE